MTKWEYRRKRFKYEVLQGIDEGLVAPLNKWGADGWELVHCNIEEFPDQSVCFALCIFKRPVQERSVTLVVETGGPFVARASIPVDGLPAVDPYGEDDDAERWHDTWQKIDEYMRDRD